MGYSEQLANIKGKYTFVSYWHTSRGAGCEACGHIISNVFVIREVETGKYLNVGSECIKSLLGDWEAIRIVKAIKSIETKVKADYQRPLRQQQIKEFILANRKSLNMGFEDTLVWRVTHDTNPEQTLRILKDINEDVAFKFAPLTKEQKEEMKELQVKAINEFLERL